MFRDFENEAALRELSAEYEVVRELGRGGMAVVYLARERGTGRQVAIKLVRSIHLEDEDALARFAREARTVAQLQHRNIVALYGVRRLEGRRLALVMQYVPGRTLKSAIRRHGPLPFEHVERVLVDVAEALAYAHRRQIVHRDIKPENIYLDPETGRAMLADFGIARAGEGETELTRTGMSIGTPSYMSPEQIDGRIVDRRSDLYSLGLVGYEMLTGRKPWQGETLYSVIYKQKHERLPPLDELRKGIPPALRRAVERCVQKEPERRWSSAEEFLTALRHGAPGTDTGPESAPAPAPWAPTASGQSAAGQSGSPAAAGSAIVDPGAGRAVGGPVSPDSPTVRYVRPASVGREVAVPTTARGRAPASIRAAVVLGGAALLFAASAAVLAAMWQRAVPGELRVSPPEDARTAGAATRGPDEPGSWGEPAMATVLAGPEPAAAPAGTPAATDSGRAVAPTPPAAGPAGADSAAADTGAQPRALLLRPLLGTTLVDEAEIRQVLELAVLGKRHAEPRFLRRGTGYLLVETRNLSTWPIRSIAGELVIRDRQGERLKTLQLRDDRLLPPGGVRREVYQWSTGIIEFPRDRRLRETPFQELAVEWVPQRVVFGDGLDRKEERSFLGGLGGLLGRLLTGDR
ncbi:MAG TPA: serine/threonine-protein kinase [Longimicrobiales bacterium]